jgi:hypothetical protein
MEPDAVAALRTKIRAGFDAARAQYGEDVPPLAVRDPILADLDRLFTLLGPPERKRRPQMPKTQKTLVAMDEPVDIAIQHLVARARQEDTDVVGAARDRLRPAVELARAALPRFAAFEQAHGARLRHQAKLLREPELDRVEGAYILIEQARHQVKELLDLLGNPDAIRQWLAEVESLTRTDVEQEAFSPSLVATLRERLSLAAGGADRLPDLRAQLEETWARLGRRLGRDPELLPVPAEGRADLDTGPPRAPRFAKSSLSQGGAE